MEAEPECTVRAWHMVVPGGQFICISRLCLVDDPSSSGGQRVVNVWAEDGHGACHHIGALSAEEPVVAGPPVAFAGEVVVLQDCAADIVRFHLDGYALDQPAPLEGEEEGAVLGEDVAYREFEPLDEEDAAEMYDSDNGDEGEEDEPPCKVRDREAAGESSKRASITQVAASAGNVVPKGEFLGPARFAAVENTAGFMRVAATESSVGQEGKEILVLYRYTRFSRTWSGRRGVEACRRTKLHRLRFAVPPAGDMASSLAWAGSSLGPLIYPALFRRPLQDLWSSLVAPAISGLPPQATRLEVMVDVGILRREDHTPERMDYMQGELEAMAHDAWPAHCHVAKELRLPEPVRLEEEEDSSTQPTKRRRIAAAADNDDEECSVCFEPLESGLAAWPGCAHVFHSACVEQTLAVNEMCPLCRHKLSDILIG
ncbi:hypothetical protein ACP70R_003423 [Stipagrostis hirtigluma subsp. patula]